MGLYPLYGVGVKSESCIQDFCIALEMGRFTDEILHSTCEEHENSTICTENDTRTNFHRSQFSILMDDVYCNLCGTPYNCPT